MRKLRVFLFLLLVLVTTSVSQNANAAIDLCPTVVCGFKCSVFGPFSGWCLYTEVQTTGCVQEYGPYCISMQNTRCCPASLTANGL
jgi:hypothetical protein